jgi:ATP-dependent DNA ligase
LETRRELLRKKVLSKLCEPVRYSPDLDAALPDLIRSVREQGLEGLVAKRRTSAYESGQRGGAWLKMRVNRGQEFVIGGYTVGAKNFDALIFGYYERDRLMYVARTRNGFTPALRDKLFQRFRQLETAQCPFANLPEVKSGRWGFGLTAAKMKDCRWLLCRIRHTSHNVECRTMPHASEGCDVGSSLLESARKLARSYSMLE